jgi:hypothetical protein
VNWVKTDVGKQAPSPLAAKGSAWLRKPDFRWRKSILTSSGAPCKTQWKITEVSHIARNYFVLFRLAGFAKNTSPHFPKTPTDANPMPAGADLNRLDDVLRYEEATSALDNETERTVTDSLDALQSTRIVIAHRLSTIINADKIYVLINGEMVQSGT